jgi:hypothetical protein
MPSTSLIVALLTLGLASAGQVRIGEAPPDPAKERAQAIERAKAVLAEKLKLPEKDIAVESAKAATWSDASLGCPEKDRMYAQVVTRGWAVALKAQGCPHQVHVAGNRAVVCPPPAVR